MELEEKLKIQVKLIQDLKQENEILKHQLSEMQVKLSLAEVSPDEAKDRAQKIIIAGQQVENEYKQAIQEAHKIKQEYQDGLQQIYKLKNQYKNIIDNLTKQVR